MVPPFTMEAKVCYYCWRCLIFVSLWGRPLQWRQRCVSIVEWMFASSSAWVSSKTAAAAKVVRGGIVSTHCPSNPLQAFSYTPTRNVGKNTARSAQKMLCCEFTRIIFYKTCMKYSQRRRQDRNSRRGKLKTHRRVATNLLHFFVSGNCLAALPGQVFLLSLAGVKTTEETRSFAAFTGGKKHARNSWSKGDLKQKHFLPGHLTFRARHPAVHLLQIYLKHANRNAFQEFPPKV